MRKGEGGIRDKLKNRKLDKGEERRGEWRINWQGRRLDEGEEGRGG